MPSRRETLLHSNDQTVIEQINGFGKLRSLRPVTRIQQTSHFRFLDPKTFGEMKRLSIVRPPVQTCRRRRKIKASVIASCLYGFVILYQLVVFGMRTDPNPHDAVLNADTECPMMQTGAN